MSGQITYDSTYAVTDPTDFRRMIEVDRYGRRSDAFDAIISATHDHFWDPLDPAYVDVIVRRWQAFTGGGATLEGKGVTFAELVTQRRGSAREARAAA